MLLLQRVVRTFRLGSHPAPVIPVDVVSRGIVHAALGWGGRAAGSSGKVPHAGGHFGVEDGGDGMSGEGAYPSDSSASDARHAHPISASRPRDALSAGATRDLESGAGARDLEMITPPSPPSPSSPSSSQALILNLAWARHPLRDKMKGGEPAAREGRMPSFREFGGFLWDYAVLRGLRSPTEALAVRTALAVCSLRADGGDPFGKRDLMDQRPPLERRSCADTSRLFDLLHALLDRAPLWMLEALAAMLSQVPWGWTGHRAGPLEAPGSGGAPSDLSSPCGGGCEAATGFRSEVSGLARAVDPCVLPTWRGGHPQRWCPCRACCLECDRMRGVSLYTG